MTGPLPKGCVLRDAEGPSNPRELSTRNLLVEVLGRGGDKVALVRSDLRGLSRVHPAELRERGFTPRMIRRLESLFEIARRYSEDEFSPGATFKSSYDVYAHFRERLSAEPVEHFLAVLLDNKHRKVRDICLATGSLTSSIVHPRDVYSKVIRDAAASVIFVHNHPSGDPTPSREDLEITRRLREVGDLVGVRVLDHLIIGAGRYVSFVDDGYW